MAPLQKNQAGRIILPNLEILTVNAGKKQGFLKKGAI
jgi:hypothetical protein